MEIRFSGLFEDWQKNARELLKKNVAPRDVVWVEDSGQQPLFCESVGGRVVAAGGDKTQRSGAEAASSFKVPKRFVELARNVSAFRDSRKWDLLYSVLWRIAHENHYLLKVETDDEVIRLLRMEQAV